MVSLNKNSQEDEQNQFLIPLLRWHSCLTHSPKHADHYGILLVAIITGYLCTCFTQPPPMHTLATFSFNSSQQRQMCQTANGWYQLTTWVFLRYAKWIVPPSYFGRSATEAVSGWHPAPIWTDRQTFRLMINFKDVLGRLPPWHMHVFETKLNEVPKVSMNTNSRRISGTSNGGTWPE